MTNTPKGSDTDYVLVPREQLEKVEQCRLELHRFRELRKHDSYLESEIINVTTQLWDVTHRRYDAAPASSCAGDVSRAAERAARRLVDTALYMVKNGDNYSYETEVEGFKSVILTELQAAPAHGWMPIESAPKDGTEFVTCNMNQGGTKNLISWNTLFGYWISKGEAVYMQATHWMPLPPAPRESEAG